MSRSPSLAGFNLIFRRPVIAVAEIAWRWGFAAASWFLIVFFLIEYADSLPVSTLDRLLIGSQQPILLLRALRRIFHGSALRFVEGGLVVAAGLAAIWIALAILGRIATVRAIQGELELRRGAVPARKIVTSLLGLNFLRVTITMAAVICAISAFLISGSVWASTHISVQDATRLCFAALCITWIAWQLLNWFLSTAGLFAISEGHTTFDAIAATVRLCQEKTAPFLFSGVWFGLGHFAAFVIATFAGTFILGAIGELGAGPVLFLETLIIFLYCAVVDVLYAGRLAAYLAIIAGDDISEAFQLEGDPSSGPSGVDKSELILGDVPQPSF